MPHLRYTQRNSIDAKDFVDAAEQSTINITATDVAVNRTASDQATVNVTQL